MNNIKTKRVSSLIARELSDIFYNEIRDQLLKNITIIETEVSHDLSFCKVYYNIPAGSDKKLVETELKKANKFIRTTLANRIDLRIVPELKFIYDETSDYGSAIDEILKKINNQ